MYGLKNSVDLSIVSVSGLEVLSGLQHGRAGGYETWKKFDAGPVEMLHRGLLSVLSRDLLSGYCHLDISG